MKLAPPDRNGPPAVVHKDGLMMQSSGNMIPQPDSMMMMSSSLRSSLTSTMADIGSTTRTSRHSISGNSLGGSRERPPSAQSTARPTSSRSLRSTRPSTAAGSIGLHTQVQVQSRPVTQQGMVSVRPVVQGPGRQIMDKSYYLAKLRSKKQELQSEIHVMSEEIERFQKCAPAFAQLDHKREKLQEEVKTLKTQLGDYNLALEKVASGVDLHQVDELAKALEISNEHKRQAIDDLFAECRRVDRETREFEDKIPLLELGLELQLNQESPQTRERFLDLQAQRMHLTYQVEQLERELEEVTSSTTAHPSAGNQSFKNRAGAAFGVPQVDSGEANRHPGLGSASAHDPREAILAKIRQENIQIAQIDNQCKELEAETQSLQEQVREAGKNLSNLKGGKAEKFLEMQHKEEKMQEYIDNYDQLKFDQENILTHVQQKIQILLEHVAAEMSLEGSFNIYPGLELQQPKDLQTKLSDHKSELRQIEELERNTDAQILEIKNTIHSLQRDVEKSAHSNLQSQQDVKSITLEVERRTLEEQRRLVQLQIKEQSEKMNIMKNKLKSSTEPHTHLEDLNKRIVLLEETNGRVKEEVEHKERQNNYQPIVENLKFMIGRLNDALKVNLLP